MGRRRFLLLPFLVATLGWHAPAMAEVSDKVPTLAELWISVAALTVAAFFAGAWRWWAAILVVGLSLLFASAVFVELQSPDVGPDILSELGESYVTGAWIAAWVQALAPLLAGFAGWLLIGVRRQRR